MRVIDARSGREVKVGDVVRYSDGDWWELLDLETGFTWARAWVRGAIEYQTFGPRSLPLTVRFLHPEFPLQRVAFAPT